MDYKEFGKSIVYDTMYHSSAVYFTAKQIDELSATIAEMVEGFHRDELTELAEGYNEAVQNEETVEDAGVAQLYGFMLCAGAHVGTTWPEGARCDPEWLSEMSARHWNCI